VIVYLDTNCTIYFLENHPYWWPKNGDAGLEARYRAFFNDPDIHVFPVTAQVCERAARLRSIYPFKLPDALHLATAIEHGCGVLLTGDARLARCTEITMEVLT